MKSIKRALPELFPEYMRIPFAMLVISNLLVYYGAKLFNILLHREYLDMTSSLDSMLPVLPGFTIIYIMAFPFWYVTYYLYCRRSPECCRQLVTVDVTAKLICGIIFVLMPTTNIRPAFEAESISARLLNLIYSLDTPDNLFPSIHCMESWIAYRCASDVYRNPIDHFGNISRFGEFGQIGSKRTNRKESILCASSFTFAVLICLSTLFTKQHVIADVFSGLAIAECIWQAGSLFDNYIPVSSLLSIKHR